jgi:Tol biopolymer transport system component
MTGLAVVVPTGIASAAQANSVGVRSGDDKPTLTQAPPVTPNPPGIVYSGFPSSFDQQLYLTNLTGSTRHQLTFDGGHSTAVKPRWGPFGGKVLYVRGGAGGHELWLVGANGRHDHLLRAFHTGRFVFDMAWAPGAGRIAVVLPVPGGNTNDVYIYTPRTNSLTRLHVSRPSVRDVFTVDWSHEGRRIVFSAAGFTKDQSAYQEDLYSVAPDGHGLRRLTDTARRDETSPRWSPDDSRLLFSKASHDGSACEDWIVNAAADGTDQQRVRGACTGLMADW